MNKLLLLLCFLSLPIFASEDPDWTPINILIDRAVQMTGYSKPTAILKIDELDEASMAEFACHATPCGVIGLYDNDDIIHIRDDISPSDHDHYLFHEIVHWLQDHSGIFSHNCQDTYIREVEAYDAESRYMAQYQNSHKLPIIPLHNPCHQLY